MLRTSLIICTLLCMALALEGDVARAKRSAETNILKLISQASTRNNPNQSLGCFTYYSPLMNAVMEEYEANCSVCTDKANEERKAADATTVEQRAELEADSANACEAVTVCKSTDSAKAIFECYIEGAASSSKALNSISSDASTKLVVFQKKLRSIDSDEKICLTESKLQYEKDWNKVYDEFSDCMNGLSEVPTQAPPGSKAVLTKFQL